MARISNTTAYPQIATLDTDDYILLTDKDNKLMTKSCSIGKLQEKFGIDTLVAHVEVTPTDLLSLSTSNKVIIPSPGVDKVIDVISLAVNTVPGTTAYNFNDPLEFVSAVDQTIRAAGTTTGQAPGPAGDPQNKIVDTAATFITSGVLPGDIATYTISGVTTNTVVTNVISETQLQVAAENLDTFPVTYIIYTPENTVSLGTIPAVDMNTIHQRVYKLVQPSSNYHMGAGSPLRLKCASNPTQGNGNMFVNIFYRVLTIGTSF